MTIILVHDFACTWTGVEGAMLHNDVRIKTQFDKLNLILSSELESLITISYDTKTKNNRINLTNAPFSVTEDPFRWALEDCKKNINRGKKFTKFSFFSGSFHTTVFSIHQQTGVDSNKSVLSLSIQSSSTAFPQSF